MITTFTQHSTSIPPKPAIQPALQRKCACGGTPGPSGECEECRKKRLGMAGRSLTQAATSLTGKPISVTANQVSWEQKDKIHGPMLDEYHESVDRVAGAPRVSDAALKYSGALGRAGSAHWVAPTLNPRNFAPVWFNSTVLGGEPAGLTTPFINGQKIDDEGDARKALPVPPISSRVEGGRTRCWFSSGVSATGKTVMDILSPGPWTHTAAPADVEKRIGREAQSSPALLKQLSACKNAKSDVTVRVTGALGDAEMEEYIKKGEAEHDIVFQKAFEDNIGLYAGNVNALIGGRPELELSGTDLPDCSAKLTALANRDGLVRKFLLDSNAANSNVHQAGRHLVDTKSATVDSTCSTATVTLRHGKLTPLKP